MSYIYIASPYSHPLASVRQDRYAEVLEVLEELHKAQIPCYSPIVHWHNVALAGALPTDAEFWKVQNLAMMKASLGGLFLLLPGHRDSAGMAFETDWFVSNKKPTWCCSGQIEHLPIDFLRRAFHCEHGLPREFCTAVHKA